MTESDSKDSASPVSEQERDRVFDKLEQRERENDNLRMRLNKLQKENEKLKIEKDKVEQELGRKEKAEKEASALVEEIEKEGREKREEDGE